MYEKVNHTFSGQVGRALHMNTNEQIFEVLQFVRWNIAEYDWIGNL